MNKRTNDPIVDLVGEESFSWLSRNFSRKTTLEDVPAEVLESVSKVDIARRDYGADSNAVTAIALLTFAYAMAGKSQEARHGSNDLMLVKALSRGELDRRCGRRSAENPFWKKPLFELITGDVGDRIRAARFMTNPVKTMEQPD